MEQIAGYEITAELGRGAMGAVYRGRHLASGREVALKTLLAGRDATPLQRQRFQREARALAQLDHPHVVRLFDASEHHGVPYLAMEFHPGGSLDDVIRRSRLPVADAIQLGTQLASALEAAHAQGILHRDLKPDNVLIGADGAARLTDFGLAKDLQREGQTQRLTQSGIFLGSPGYWAPEQAAAQAEQIGPGTDVYGLGAILYAALVGRPPILASSLVENLHLTANERPPSLRSQRAEVPPGLEAIVLRCLEKEVSARWASAEELAAALASLEDGQSPPGLRRAWVVGLLCLILTAAIGVGLSLRSQDEAQPTPTPSPASTPSPSAQETPPPTAHQLYQQATALLRAKRDAESVPLLRRSAEQGHVKAAFKLGYVLAKGIGVERDVEQAIPWYRQAVAGGHPFATYELAEHLARGEGLERDDAQARRLFLRAAEKGNRSSMTSYGEFLERGRGGPKDMPSAIEWYRRAAEAGQDRGMFHLGRALEAGRGVPRDQGRAAFWFRRSAEAGYGRGMFKFAWYLENGFGVAKDKAQAIAWYQRAAQEGVPEAMTSYATYLEFGDGLPRDVKAAVEWYRRATEAGHPGGMLGLGRCYQKGRSVPQDDVRGTALYRQAAELGSASAMVAFGLSLASGRGVPVDKAQAALWFRKAADLGDPNGAFSLANMLLKGEGVPQDKESAAILLKAAIAKNHPESMCALGGLLMDGGQGDREAETKARELFQRSAELGYLDGMFNLGVAYALGRGGPQNVPQARKWFRVVAGKTKSPSQRRAALDALQKLER